LKRSCNPLEVFEKLDKKINRKKGPTGNWECTYNPDNESILIDFGDDKSETFCLELNSKEIYNGFCKVYFDLGPDSFAEDSEFKALLDIFYSIKNKFSLIEFSDDYGLAAGYWDSKRFKFEYRDLTDEEYERVERIYNQGYTTPEKLLRAIMAEDMEMPYQQLVKYENPDISMGRYYGKIYNTLLTYVYETSEFRNEGRVSDSLAFYVGDPDKHTFAIWAFMEGISWIFCDGSADQNKITLDKHFCSTPVISQIDLIYREKFAPLFLKENDALKKCVLVYRYFLSVYGFAGFKYGGYHKNPLVIDEIMKEYGEIKGTQYLKIYVTSEKYIFQNPNGKEYGSKLTNNIIKHYGEDFLVEYVKKFKRKYEGNIRFRQETIYYAETKLKYVDDKLVI